MDEAPSVRVLAMHSLYRCRSAGECCTSGWPIAVEPAIERRLREATAAGRLRGDGLVARHATTLLAVREGGRCAFFDASDRRCEVHRALGHEALPLACRQFPRVAVLTPMGVSVSLSHYCPTAVGLLTQEDASAEIVADAPGFPRAAQYEGLDARRSFGPLLRPGVLLGWDVHERWERATVEALSAGRGTAEEALARVAAAAEDLRAWSPGGRPLLEHARDVIARLRMASHSAGSSDPTRLPPPAFARSAWDEAAAAVPSRLRPPTPPGLDDADARWVAPVWASHAALVKRYLAARAFASWCALQGEGVRTSVRALATTLCVLRLEAARGAAEAGRALDRDLLREAVRRADLLLVHLVAPEELAARLSRREHQPVLLS